MEELLDIVDVYGNPTGQTVERKKAHAEGIMHRTSHVWILRKKDGKTEILLQQRSKHKDSFPGCYDISSAGHIPAGDGYKKSALRELKEELSVEASEEELIFCGDRLVIWDDSFDGKPFHDRQYSRVFALWKDMEEGDFVLQKEEVDAVKWMEFGACVEAVKKDEIPNCIVPEELQMVYEHAAANKD